MDILFASMLLLLGAQMSVQDTAFNPWGINPEVELLDHMVILFLIFYAIAILFSIFHSHW